jgi:hypothetical protein
MQTVVMVLYTTQLMVNLEKNQGPNLCRKKKKMGIAAIVLRTA